MDQSSIQIDPTVCHSTLKPNETICGLAYFPDKQDQLTFAQEAVKYYRLMVFFKNYQYDGPADLTFVYLWIVMSYYLRTIEKETTEEGARKKLTEIAREKIAVQGDRNFFLGNFQKDPKDNTEATTFQSYMKTLKELVSQELLKILFLNGQRSNDFKHWVGVSKRKFMNMSYTGV